MKRLDPEAKIRRRVLRFLKKLRRLKLRAANHHIRNHFDADGKAHCSKRCPVAAIERERLRLAELLAEGKGE